ncbi:MAG: sodium-dependent transporter [Halanaerobiales bacterium]
MDNNKLKEGEGFSSKWGLLFSLIALSAGSGNIWRFPRIAAQAGGGSFVIAWTICLFIFSVPLIIGETIMGRSTRHGCIGAFRDFVGEKFSWMGAFLVYCGLGIGAYYSVIVGWTFKYTILQAMGGLNVNSVSEAQSIWDGFISSGGQVLLFHFLAIVLTGYVVYRGIVNGIEMACKITIPAVFVILIITSIRAVTLDGAIEGLNFLFRPEWKALFEAETWLHALTQSAWSVGPGWGLVITYAAHTKSSEDVTFLEFGHGIGNNIIALLAGITILPSIFAFAPSQAYVEEAMAAGNTGLVFNYLPMVFSEMYGGRLLGVLFFLGFALAAYSTLIATFEIGVVTLMDMNIGRKKATIAISIALFVAGIPSALFHDFLNNQDMVLAVALLIASLFVAIAFIKYGTTEAREKFLNNEHAVMRTGKWWDVLIKYVIPVLVIVVIGWWLKQSIEGYPKTWWNPFEVTSFGTIAVQILIWSVIFKSFNNKLASAVKNIYFNDKNYPPIPNRVKELD